MTRDGSFAESNRLFIRSMKRHIAGWLLQLLFWSWRIYGAGSWFMRLLYVGMFLFCAFCLRQAWRYMREAQRRL